MTEEEKLRDRLTKLDALAARPGTPDEGCAAQKRADTIRARLAQIERAKAETQRTDAWAATQRGFDNSAFREPSPSARPFRSAEPSRSGAPGKARLSNSLGRAGVLKAAALGLVVIAGSAWAWRAESPNAPKGSLMLRNAILTMHAESRQASMRFKDDSFICFTRARARSSSVRAKSLAAVDDYLAFYKDCMDERGWRGEPAAK